jgi:hypothetical protein
MVGGKMLAGMVVGASLVLSLSAGAQEADREGGERRGRGKEEQRGGERRRRGGMDRFRGMTGRGFTGPFGFGRGPAVPIEKMTPEQKEAEALRLLEQERRARRADLDRGIMKAPRVAKAIEAVRAAAAAYDDKLKTDADYVAAKVELEGLETKRSEVFREGGDWRERMTKIRDAYQAIREARQKMQKAVEGNKEIEPFQKARTEARIALVDAVAAARDALPEYAKLTREIEDIRAAQRDLYRARWAGRGGRRGGDWTERTPDP